MPRFFLGLLTLSLALASIAGCSTALHGSFVTSSYAGDPQGREAELLGPVEGKSCQTQPLYLLAAGEQATTDSAIEQAKAVYPDSSFITDISIDDETEWLFGYSVQCIVVRATAYRWR